MRAFRARVARSGGAESGAALVTVMGYTLIMSLLVGLAVFQAQNVLRSSRHTQDFQAAMQSAYGAVNDYLYRTQSDPGYSRFSDIPAANCAGVPSVAMTDPDNPFMGGSFAPLPGGAGGSSAKYQIDASQLCQQGVITLKVTGRSATVERKADFLLKRTSFLDFTYFSDFEALDPAFYATNPFAAQGTTVEHMCTRHHYEPTAPNPTFAAPRPEVGLEETPGCATINWVTGDRVSGPIHTNDALLVCGSPSFAGKVTTSFPGTKGRHYLSNSRPACSSGYPDFKGNREQNYCGGSNDPCYAEALRLPPVNSALETVPGACVFTGPTKITLRPDGKFDVDSPYTTGAKKGCAPGSGLDVPTSGVLYVRDVPATTAVPCATPAGWAMPRNAVGFPEQPTDITAYDCRAGDAFVSGTNAGRVTIGAEHAVVVTSTIETSTAKKANAVVGLVGNQGIQIYHPVDAAGTNLLSAPVQKIEAALLAVNHSIAVQNYDKGEPLGKLTIHGAIAQRWRGLMGTADGKHGYLKNYEYEEELKWAEPPNFLQPLSTSWRMVRVDQY